ncbi:MAG: hypothetical protein ABH879_03605 [archaeon]
MNPYALQLWYAMQLYQMQENEDVQGPAAESIDSLLHDEEIRGALAEAVGEEAEKDDAHGKKYSFVFEYSDEKTVSIYLAPQLEPDELDRIVFAENQKVLSVTHIAPFPHVDRLPMMVLGAYGICTSTGHVTIASELTGDAFNHVLDHESVHRNNFAEGEPFVYMVTGLRRNTTIRGYDPTLLARK